MKIIYKNETKLKALLLIILSGWSVLILLRYFKNTPPLPSYLPELIVLGFILLVTFLIGKKLLGYLGFQENFCLRFFLFATAMGFGAVALFILILGQFRLLYPELMLGLSFLLILLARSALTSLLTQAYKGVMSLQNLNFSLGLSVLWLVFFVTAFLSLIHALAPPVSFDVLVYHLGLPNLYLQDHRISTYPYMVYSYYPLNMEMIYTFSLLLYKSDILPTLLHFAVGIFTALSIYELSRWFFNKKVGLVALLIFYSTPMVMLLSTVAKNDLLLAYFEILSLLSFLLWIEKEDGMGEWETRRHRDAGTLRWLPYQLPIVWLHPRAILSSSYSFTYLVLSAVFCGLAIGTKYTGVYFFITLCLLILLHGWTWRRKKYGSMGVWEYSLIAGSVAAPWLVRNFILTKNPFYPALSGVFGVGDFLRPELKELTITGLNLDLLAFLRLPWDMTLDPFRFGHFSHLGPAFLIFLPFLFWRNTGDAKTRLPVVKYLGWFSFFFFIFCTITLPSTRFYLSGIAVLSVLIAYFIMTLTGGRDRVTPPLLKYLIGLVMGFIIAHNIYLFVYLEATVFNPLPVTFNLKSEKEYLVSQVDYYPVAQFINETLPVDAKILLLGEMRSYYINRPILVNTAYNTTIIIDLINASGGIPDLLARLKNLGVTHVLFNSHEAKRLQEHYFYFNFPGKREEDLYNEFVKSHLQPLFFKNGVYLYEVKY